MQVKVNRILPKPFIILTTITYSIAGLMLGIVLALSSIFVPAEPEGANFGFWSILIFPIINALIGAASSLIMCFMYNYIASLCGGLEFEVEETQK